MIKVEVAPNSARLVSWPAKGTREAGSMRVQEVWAHTIRLDGRPSLHPEKTELILDRSRTDEDTGEVKPAQAPYAPGEYTLHPSSFYVDREGRPAFALRLTPLKKPS